MLLQITFDDELAANSEYRGMLFCSRCSAKIGLVTQDELTGLLNKQGEDALCFDCEDSPPSRVRELGKQEKTNLLGVFDLEGSGEIPTFGCSGWRNEKLNIHLQLVPRVGWCLWFPDPDGMLKLKRVRIAHTDVLLYKRTWEMSPVFLVL